MSINKEDYEEPCCPLDMHPETSRIPLGRIIEKLDSLFEQKNFEAAKKLLDYWQSEADAVGDMQGKLTVINEKIGLCRKVGIKEECFSAIDSALALVEKLGFENNVTGGTTFINCATGYEAFGLCDSALSLYRRAKAVYEHLLSPNDDRLAGLYNNMALALTALNNYSEAEELFKKAIVILERQEHGEAELAITYLNLADLVNSRDGIDNGGSQIDEHIKQAEALLDTESLPKDGYYAFVCEKCAPVFGGYGYFWVKEKLMQRASDIYKRS